MEELDLAFLKLKNASQNVRRNTDTSSQSKYSCPKCKDRELVEVENGLWGFCECRKQKLIERRIKSSMIDQTFSDATFKNFIPAQHTINMFTTAKEYTEHFETVRHERHNGLGFLAKVGESVIRQTTNPQQRAALKEDHNSEPQRVEELALGEAGAV